MSVTGSRNLLLLQAKNKMILIDKKKNFTLTENSTPPTGAPKAAATPAAAPGKMENLIQLTIVIRIYLLIQSLVSHDLLESSQKP